VPGHSLGPLGVEPLDPAVDGPGATEQQRADRGPGVASSSSKRMWARKRTSGSGSLRYRPSNAWRCRASREMLRVMDGSPGYWT
jgi:hypothetical protein